MRAYGDEKTSVLFFADDEFDAMVAAHADGPDILTGKGITLELFRYAAKDS